MTVRMRATVKDMNNRGEEMRTASDLRQDLWAHAPVGADPAHPLYGIHRDESGRAYIEFATDSPDEVRRVMEQHQYANRAELTESPSLPGGPCLNCGNVAGPVQPAVCPSCGLRDISDCPVCRNPISREAYSSIAGDVFRCPNCKNRVRLHFNNPMCRPDGHFNPPLVVVEEALAGHEVR